MKTVQLTKELRWLDVWVGASYVFMLIAKAASIISLVKVEEFTQAGIQNVALAFETNPWFKVLLGLNHFGVFVNVVLFPGLLIAYYVYVKRQVRQGVVKIDTLTFFVMFALFALLGMMINDLSGLVGLMLR